MGQPAQLANPTGPGQPTPGLHMPPHDTRNPNPFPTRSHSPSPDPIWIGSIPHFPAPRRSPFPRSDRGSAPPLAPTTALDAAAARGRPNPAPRRRRSHPPDRTRSSSPCATTTTAAEGPTVAARTDRLLAGPRVLVLLPELRRTSCSSPQRQSPPPGAPPPRLRQRRPRPPPRRSSPTSPEPAAPCPTLPR